MVALRAASPPPPLQHLPEDETFTVVHAPKAFPTSYVYYMNPDNDGFKYLNASWRGAHSFQDFASMAQSARERVYLQELISLGPGRHTVKRLGPAVQQDLDALGWEWLEGLADSVEGGERPERLMLWYGEKGVVSPCHTDGQNNYYSQIRGRKNFLLFPDADHPRM
jgi:hypothetical protein